MINPTEMISFGAGVNSVAMTILLVNDGWRGPIVFADPGAEHPDTYCYIEYFQREWLRLQGLEVTRISPTIDPDLYLPSYRVPDIIEKCKEKHIVPIVVSRWCTTEFKRRPLTRWAKAHKISCQLLGIAAEESHRARFSESDGVALDFPLIDRRIGRDQCKDIIQAEGLAVPPKSGCWLCPFQRPSEWRALYDLRPDLFNIAVELDEAACDKWNRESQLGVNMKMRLSEVRRMWDAQLELPLMPEPEYEYQMCECRL